MTFYKYFYPQMKTYLQHFIVKTIEQITEKLLCILLASLDFETVSATVQDLVNNRWLERRWAVQVDFSFGSLLTPIQADGVGQRRKFVHEVNPEAKI